MHPTRYPLLFQPLYQHRIWGGRTLEARFQRPLPPGPIGESWELTDRPGAVSVVANGPLAGTDLHTLWLERPDWFTDAAPRPARFPLLIKLLDCHEKLSVQVHPDPAAAHRLGSESKAELWVVLEAAPDAEIFAGFRRGVTREAFEAAIAQGGSSVVGLLHRLEPRPGDVMFVPPGRLHAIGAGTLICEVQQNADTTYRVYDWDRPGLDGAPRPLHRTESLECLDFTDFEPAFLPAGRESLLEHPFRVERIELDAPTHLDTSSRALILVPLEGTLRIDGEAVVPGRCVLLPRGLEPALAVPDGPGCQLLRVCW